MNLPATVSVPRLVVLHCRTTAPARALLILLLVALAVPLSATRAEAAGTDARLAAGALHACAVASDGTPVCWGANGENQRTIPAGTGTVTQITTGDFHTCAVKAGRTPVCWGDDASGKATVPGDIGTVTQVAAGTNHTCAIRTDRTPAC